MIQQIENRKTIEKIAQNPFLSDIAVISICDFGCSFAEMIYKPDYLLCIQFDDIGEDIFEDILSRKPTPQERRSIAKKYHMITESQAEKDCNILSMKNIFLTNSCFGKYLPHCSLFVKDMSA